MPYQVASTLQMLVYTTYWNSNSLTYKWFQPPPPQTCKKGRRLGALRPEGFRAGRRHSVKSTALVAIMIKFWLATDGDPSVPYMTINILNKFLLITKLIKSKHSYLTKIVRISSNSFWEQKEILKFFCA